jgi:glycosyltransferase involved in cell wall biosynthesis
MKASISFTIIIPTYNRADLILNAVNSILNQTCKDFEIIIVDNKSTDNTVEVLTPFLNRPEITLLVNEKNFERSYSRNRGIAAARFSYITFLDSDDILYPDCLKDAKDYIEKNPDSSFFHCLHEVIDENLQPLRQLKFPPLKNPFKKLMEGNFISNIGVFYKKELLQKIKFDETPLIIGIEDYDFVIRVLSEAGTLGRINKINCGAMQHFNRSVYQDDLPTIVNRVLHFEAKTTEAIYFDKFKKYKNIFQSNLKLYLSNTFAVNKKGSQAFRLLREAVKAYPLIIFNKKFFVSLAVLIKFGLKRRALYQKD